MRKFKMKDENFNCLNCGKEIIKLGYSARNHCPHCLHSLHLDIYPGDRLSKCKGVLKPIGIINFKHSFKIKFECQKCGEIKYNIVADDDNYDIIIALSVAKD